jgi:hypothetical protein
MARSKSLIAIFLALTLLVSPTVSVFADDPPPLRDQGNDLDGHPWDDGSGESTTDPGNDPNTPGNVATIGDQQSGSFTASATAGSGSQFVAQLTRILFAKWLKVSEMKVVKSKSVQRVR